MHMHGRFVTYLHGLGKQYINSEILTYYMWFVVNPAMLNGKKVVGTEGNILGEVDGIDIDLSVWKTTAFYVILSDEATVNL